STNIYKIYKSFLQLALLLVTSLQRTLITLHYFFLICRTFYYLAKPFIILQINIGRGATLYKIALSLANNSLIDIILIQELYIFKDYKQKIMKFYLIYKSFTLLDN